MSTASLAIGGWSVLPQPCHHRAQDWIGGRFETATRKQTARVEGRISPSRHIVMVTLRGGARRHEFRADDGLRFSGCDSVGSVSFLPAGCGRNLNLTDVAWEWGAISLDPEHVSPRMVSLGPFVAAKDPFLHGLISQMHLLLQTQGELDATYCSAMSMATAEYLLRRAQVVPNRAVDHRLTARQLRLTLEQIDAQLHMPLRIADLARSLDLSEGHFFRAFKGAIGRSPLSLILDRRIERAARLLTETDNTVTEVAFEVGLGSPSHLARLFRARMGYSPSDYRRLYRKDNAVM